MIAVVAIIIILAIMLIKYKVVYKVTISGEEVGYVLNKNEFEKLIDKEINKIKTINKKYIIYLLFLSSLSFANKE